MSGVDGRRAAAFGALRIFDGENEIAALPADSRARMYGDGLFETMRAHGGDVPWWDAHWARLVDGASRLAIPLPAEPRVRGVLRELLVEASAVVRLQLERGPGARGYAPSAGAAPLWSLAVHAPPPVGARPLVLRWCETRMAIQPALAGIKHCNRLEQVLARAEWQPATGGADDGLMLDTAGDVVCATSANVFVHLDDEWLTPPVDRCGVRGVCRDWVLDAVDARERRLAREDVERADAVFLCNAVRGILEVARLGDREWPRDPRIARLRARLAAEHPAFALE